MADDPEKRFHSIMNKLFHSPNSLPNPSSSSSSSFSSSDRGKKRANPESSLALVEPKAREDAALRSSQRSLAPAEPPLCRPWDRGDLMRRLATFKSMTWFAKPKVVSAVNCARKGWINLDIDIIGCEACGARLLFSTPSSWTQQQVEKAALVFSLKLDNGHKFLCPWIDNACDERLAEFPPAPPPVLVEKFRERSANLLQLLALPVISLSAIEHMRSAQLEEFLRQSLILDYGNESINISQVQPLNRECEADAANMYYQAQKLISLCGWEPRSLPYVVDCKDRPQHLSKDADVLDSSLGVTKGQNTSISCYSAMTNENQEATKDVSSLSGLDSDPHSIVLDCKLCGATVGLWTFSAVPRPLESFRLVGHTEVNSNKNPGEDSGNEIQVNDGGAAVNSISNLALFSVDRPSNLNLTIAGGPPPMRQNFKATISLPVVGRNLRARFAYDSGFRDHTFVNQETRPGSKNQNLFIAEKGLAENSLGEQVSQPDAVGMLKSKIPDQEQCSYASGDQSFCLNLDNGEKDSALGKESDIHWSLDGTYISIGNFLEIDMHDFNMECLTDSTAEIAQIFDQSDRLPENAQNAGSLDLPGGSFDGSQVRISSLSEPSTNITNGNRNNDNGLLAVVTSENSDQQQVPSADILCVKDVASKKDIGKSETHSDTQNTSNDLVKSKAGFKERVQNLTDSGNTAYGTGEELKDISDKSMEFDPIRQHRHFCPWIVSTNSTAAGWQQTLSALFRQKEYSSPTKSPSTTVIKVDDPITSVRKLFMSPSTKRMKLTHGSS